MKSDDFKRIVDHMRTSNYPRRTLFVTSVELNNVRKLVSSLDVHEAEIGLMIPTTDATPEKQLDKRLRDVCEEYRNKRKEPACLIVKDAVLLARFSISLTPLLRNAISPRSLVILCVPKAPEMISQPNLLNLIEQDFMQPIQRLARQISEPDCIIEE